MSEEKKASYYQIESAWKRLEGKLKETIVDADSDDDLREVRCVLSYLREQKDDFLRDIRNWTY